MSEHLLQQSTEKISTSDLTHRLLKKFGTTEEAITAKYIAATQVRPLGSHGDTTADAVIVGNWPSVGYEIQGFEIKISRSDWLNEVKSPNKNSLTKRFCDRWWLVIASETYVRPNELPDDWGMMVAHGTGLRVVKDAPKLEPIPPDARFISGLMRANKRNHIPEDLHAQYINDNNRTTEARLRREFEELREFAKVMEEAFGLELTQLKQWVNPNSEFPGGGYKKSWVAKTRNRYSHYTPDDLRNLLELVLSGDFDKIHADLRRAHENASQASQLLEKYANVREYRL